jgi:hypothetical protein
MQYLLRIILPETPSIRALRRVRRARGGEPCHALSAKEYKLIRTAEDVFANHCARPGDITCDDGPGREVILYDHDAEPSDWLYGLDFCVARKIAGID